MRHDPRRERAGAPRARTTLTCLDYASTADGEARAGAARVFVPVPRAVAASVSIFSCRAGNYAAGRNAALTAILYCYFRVYIRYIYYISSPLSVSLAVRLISYIARPRAPSRPSERNCRAELGAGGGHGRGIVPWCRALVPTAPSLCVPNNYWSASSRRPRAPSKTPLASRGRASSQDPPPAPQAAHQQAYEGFHTCSRPVDGR